jgi:deaminated glutathione amidase
MTTFTAAMVQLRSGRSLAANIEQASTLIRQAAQAGAHYVQTPEMTSLLDRNRDALIATVGTEDTDAALAALRALAKDLSIWLHVGSLALRTDGTGKAVNRAVVIGPEGGIRARYDKIHMFDVNLPNGETWQESAIYQPGNKAVSVDLPWGKLGLSICYDLRFPALAHALAEQGASFLSFPAAFTRQTGEAHWHILLRARAIETGSFVFAAAQGGVHEDGRETFGHSLIVDPWGKVLGEGGTEPGIVLSDIDTREVLLARQRIPALKNAREFTTSDQQCFIGQVYNNPKYRKVRVPLPLSARDQ